jgi:hypothetical protein
MTSSISIPLPDLSALKLSGAKTYMVATAAVGYALYGYFTGHLDANTAAGFLMSGAGGAALRAGLAKVGAFVQAHQAQLEQVTALVQAVQQAQAAAVPPSALPPGPTP